MEYEPSEAEQAPDDSLVDLGLDDDELDASILGVSPVDLDTPDDAFPAIDAA